MAFPVFVSATSQLGLSVSANSFSVPAGAQTGDLLFVMANLSAATSNNLVMPSGWTLIQENTADAFREKLVVGFRVHDGSASYSFSTSNSAGGRIRLFCYRGQAASNPINASAIKLSQAAGATLDSTPIAAAAGLDSIEVLFAASLDANNTSVIGSGVTSRANSSSYLSFDLADAQAAAGSNTTAKTVTWGATGLKRTIINVVVSGTASSAVVPQGTTTVGAINDVNTNSASVQFSYSASDQTGFEYRLNGGSPVTIATSPINLTSLTPSTSYSVEVRAVNLTGPGAWSTAASFTTASVVGPIASFTTGALTDLNGVLQANKALLFLAAYNKTTGQLVVRKTTGLTTDTNGRCTISDAALTQGQEYRWDWETAEGHRCMPLGTAQ